MSPSGIFGIVLFIAILLLIGSYAMLFIGISQPAYAVGKVDPQILNWSGAVLNLIAVIIIAISAAGVAKSKTLF